MVALARRWRVTVVPFDGAFWLVALDQFGVRYVNEAMAFYQERDAWAEVDEYSGRWSPVGVDGWVESSGSELAQAVACVLDGHG